MPKEAALALVIRQVEQGAITRQEAMVAALKAKGRDITRAERTLDLFMQTQKIFEDHLAAILREAR